MSKTSDWPWGVWAVRTGGILGYRAAWLKRGDEVLRYETRREAQGIADSVNARTRSPNVVYEPRRFDDPETD